MRVGMLVKVRLGVVMMRLVVSLGEVRVRSQFMQLTLTRIRMIHWCHEFQVTLMIICLVTGLMISVRLRTYQMRNFAVIQ